MRKRRGIALIATLSLIAAMGTVVAATSGASRDVRQAAANRMSMLRGRWVADGCAAVAIAQLDEILGAAKSPSALNGAWASLDSILLKKRTSLGGACAVALIPAGTTVSANRISETQLRALVGALEPAIRRDSLVDAFQDWVDADSVARDRGAEASWYSNAGRAVPGNSAFRNEEEIRLVRGWEHADALIKLLSIDYHRIVLDRAPRAVLETLDGLPAEAVIWIDRHRGVLRGQDLSVMLDQLSASSQQIMAGNYAALRAVTSAAPEMWYLESTSPLGERGGVLVRLSIVRAANHVVVTKRQEGFL